MKQPRNSVDGFVPRRYDARLGERHTDVKQPRPHRSEMPSVSNPDPQRRTLHTGTAGQEQLRPIGVSRSEVSESLKNIDQTSDQEKKLRRKDKKASLHPRRKKIIKRIGIGLAVVLLLVFGYVGIRGFLASRSIFQGNVLDLFQSQPLKTDQNGRSNILIFGTNEDNIEGGVQHDGALLTDSIMVLSVDQKNYDAAMVSIPRDLWVDYGATCMNGYEGRINALYECYSEDGELEDEGADALREKVSEVTGLDVQYYVHVNHTVVKEAVDAVGGIDLTVESEDPRGILDRNFDWKCDYTCYYVKYEDGEKAHMDGEHALAFMRARNANGGYGLPNGNFDREKNQQRVIKALREKALSVGTLTNVNSVTKLMEAAGNNLRTSFETKEVRTLMKIAKETPTDKIVTINLVSEQDPVLTTGNVAGQSIVQPVLGLYDYTQMESYIAKHLTNDPTAKESAIIAVLNGSGAPGVAGLEAAELESNGFTVGTVDNAPEGEYGQITIYQLDSNKPATKKKLEEYYGVKAVVGEPPVYVGEDTAFVVILGSGQ